MSVGIQTEPVKADAPRTFTKAFDTLLGQFEKKNQGVVVLVDEVALGSDALRSLTTTFQSLKPCGYDVMLVMAGLPQCIRGLINDKVLTFLGRAAKIELGQVEIGEVVGYYTEAFAELEIHVDRALVYTLAQASQGVPYAMQLLGHYLFLAVSGGSSANERDVEYAVDCMRRDFDRNVLVLTVDMLSSRDLELLCAMSEVPGQTSTVADLQEKLGWDHNNFSKYRNRLIDFGVAVSAGRGKLNVAVPYLAEYVNEVLEE